ncbi:putative ribosomal RNA processing protein [Paecilomyces variotii]|uniref:Putative ribosomal RNA processing protein n=1 Tax=Byssochlamys spectabilis TaxID=264951 RepID=A0A443HV56_BYSSP|nr:putative ribosomal RNA processing protein [Paecilomyces variotii]KAJ9291117.1 hypothetical protein DTO021C3_1333 [Paecilomyces variotii]KAJ9360222.1 hypothetical protein DTO280E4_4444 [Paecilomyces variotii]RWQ95706.1 putative ribosomal RNA processing protein [Paecilomyces variotii]
MTDIQKTPFVRELASSDRRTRDKALESLTMFLKMKTGLSLVDLLKVWKGLFFCFYHSDRPLTQQSLARSLSYSIVPSLPHSTLHRFLRAFWITIGRDFHKIDRLRLDKYLYLIRCYVGVAFEVFIKNNNNKSSTKQNNDKKSANGEKDKKRKRDEVSMTTEKNKKKKKRTTTKTDANGTPTHEEEEEGEESTNLDSQWTDLESYISIIEEGPLHPLNFDPNEPTSTSINTDSDVTMPHGPDGLRYHILDIWLDELEKVVEVEDLDVDSSNNNTDGPTKRLKGDIPMELILRPMRKLKAESPTKTVRERAGEVLEDDRLVEWGVIERKKGSDDEDEEEDSEEEWGGLGDD